MFRDNRSNSGAQLRFQALHEIAAEARSRLPRNIWDYMRGATETETTAKRNRMAIDSLALRPRVLRDVQDISLSSKFLGADLELPLTFAPIGSLQSFDPEGGAAAARAAARHGMMTTLSSVSAPGLEETAAAAPGPKIFQLYVRGDDAWVDDHAERAIAAGYTAFCLTVDVAVYSRRERDIVNRFVKPWRRDAGGQNHQAALSWKDVERFKAKHDIPLLIKGVMTAEDAIIACDLGVDGVWVSNHGGRQLDQAQGALAVLPEIVDAMEDRAAVIVDGGFLRGTDVIKAIALGADVVGLGRLTAMGLGAGGEEGLTRAMDLLAEEMQIAMGLLGLTRLDQLGPECLTTAPAVDSPDVLSAFPLLDPNR
ncbi:MAG: alpha-hydroxy-acid oxidizing protein [Rhodospirillaceae bacterium]|jgi:glycolate oxidase|nr:alpha-hydroxy-acid oxidizing protein [Rhodospirillaceae bacterium]MBT3491735.1 alpha-hydroxy-acid oxidizing protein [Rhodospirillaceae bacterium]MBT3783209.1 alpha-hydroxy-acid oxidizing protein [Rhodospirillaceae bacterium]MBT3978205.1 alpha-hydroxy-acid oxidizing protein [Rhodospirillaceae bacterium]MBT4563591.1 alpha-hydroxy-acid oxidizing protein [Rhodospirillaceae bacterium]